MLHDLYQWLILSTEHAIYQQDQEYDHEDAQHRPEVVQEREDTQRDQVCLLLDIWWSWDHPFSASMDFPASQDIHCAAGLLDRWSMWLCATATACGCGCGPYYCPTTAIPINYHHHTIMDTSHDPLTSTCLPAWLSLRHIPTTCPYFNHPVNLFIKIRFFFLIWRHRSTNHVSRQHHHHHQHSSQPPQYPTILLHLRVTYSWIATL